MNPPFLRTLLLLALATVSRLQIAAPLPSPIPPSPPSPPTAKLVAYWAFEGEPSARHPDTSGHHHLEAVASSPENTVGFTDGIHGQALQLRGAHALSTPLAPALGTPQGLTLAAWVRPRTLSGFREILRQESTHRILFSFQEGGTILSLGLDIGGYVECDASIPPETLLDGHWHHCAASFDGQWMRVYLDGREVGSLHRPGVLSLSPEPHAYIGSISGNAEHFQGDLDELRVHTAALHPDEITALHARGAATRQRFAEALERRVIPLYPTQGRFAEVVSECRRRLAATGTEPEPNLAIALQTRLRRQFPEDCQHFTAWTGLQPADFLADPNPDAAARMAGRLVDLALEYRPLTEHQRRRQTPEEAALWQEMTGLEQRFETLVQRGPAARHDPGWVDLAMSAGPRIQFRPTVQEAVAPYVRPATPETRDPTPAEIRAARERDWLHQADGNPTAQRIRQELGWTADLLRRRRTSTPHDSDLATQTAELQRLEHEASTILTPDRDLYLRVRELKRRVVLGNPALDFDRVLFVDMPYPQGSEWQHETRHRLGYMAVPGARLLVLEGLRSSSTPRLRQLMPRAPLHGSFWRPDVSWDGRRIVFCFKPHNEKSFHLYEIGADGHGLVQLTDGPFDDLDPIYLPDGQHLVFSTTRAHTYVRCMPPTSAFVLARCRTDGTGIYLISANNEPDYLPSVLPDGRLVYTRWEYTDKPLWRAQKLWTVNPDGTQVLMYWGNQSVWPDLMKDARAIPGSRRVMFTGSAHHNWFSGSVGIVDPLQGLNFPWGLTKVTADTPWPECGNGPVDPIESPHYHSSGRFDGYYSPYPLGERDFLVSANRAGKFLLYLMDIDGNRELLHEGTHHVLHAMPIRPRPLPPILPDRVTWPEPTDRHSPADGVIFSRNVYHGAPVELQGKARFLRVFSIDAKTYTYWHKRPYISTGPVVSAVQSEGVKRLLGTVPIEPDGSVAFRAPPVVPLHFQLLDEQQRALHTMRSFVHVMPGERRGCLGCHESSSRASPGAGSALALAQPPRTITPPPWPDTTVSYPRYVRPVLDRYCAKCHEGTGEGRKTLDLTERPSAPVFTEPYLTLIGRPSWGAPYRPPNPAPPGFGIAGVLMVEAFDTVDPQAYVTPPPFQGLSSSSPLLALVTSGKHHEVNIDEISRLRLAAWIDALGPFLGDDEIREIPDPIFQGIDWLAVTPKVRSAPRILRPGPLD